MYNSTVAHFQPKKFPKLYFVAIIFLFFASNIIVDAQDKGMLRGFVADSLTAEAFPYANVS